MCLALNNFAGWIIGVATIANGVFNGYVLKMHPAFKTGQLKRIGDPSEGYETGAETFKVVVEANPELAAKANAAILQGGTAAMRALATASVLVVTCSL